jgi:hypothetical protein
MFPEVRFESRDAKFGRLAPFRPLAQLLDKEAAKRMKVDLIFRTSLWDFAGLAKPSKFCDKNETKRHALAVIEIRSRRPCCDLFAALVAKLK